MAGPCLEPHPDRVVCAAVPADLQDEEREGLVCKFEGCAAEAPAECRDGAISCIAPEGVSTSGLRFRVRTKGGRELLAAQLAAASAANEATDSTVGQDTGSPAPASSSASVSSSLPGVPPEIQAVDSAARQRVVRLALAAQQVPGAQECSDLVCRFAGGGAEAPARLEDGALTCTPPEGVEGAALRFRVQSRSSGKVVLDEDAVAAAAVDDSTLLKLQGGDAGAGAGGAGSSAPLEAEVPGPKDATRKRGALGPFAIISLAYILFTTTDGGVRMIVLLHAYQQGFTALALAAIFSGYELAGVIVNLLAGLAGAKWGIKATLLGGLTFQLAALCMLLGWQDSWTQAQAIAYITVSQVLNGIAKDLTKLGGKTVTKLVTPEEKQLALFKLVSWITGFKNSAKGFGYLLGAVLLTVNYYLSISFMIALIAIPWPFALTGLSWQLGRSADKKNVSVRAMFRMNHNVTTLSAARFFLFASRDLWFEVTLPYFLRSPASGIGWGRTLVGAFLAIWIILYGQVQSWSPQLILKPLRQSPPNKWVAVLWAAALLACPAIMCAVLLGTPVFGVDAATARAVVVITAVLYLFCLIFAVNSAVHSYLIVRYAEGNKVATTVGFYYMANAGGRLVGTLLSGFLYTYVGNNIVTGFGACFAASVVFVAASAFIASFIEDNQGGLSCGPCLQCFAGRARAGSRQLVQAAGV